MLPGMPTGHEPHAHRLPLTAQKVLEYGILIRSVRDSGDLVR